jgi:hypothetical protein
MKDSLWGDWNAVFEIGGAISFCEDNLTPIDDRDRGAWAVRSIPFLQDVIDLVVG